MAFLNKRNWCALICTPYIITLNRTYVSFWRDSVNRTELIVQQLLKSISIFEPWQLNIENVSTQLDIRVKRWDETSEAIRYKGRKFIFLNEKLSEQKQWADFSHELFHLKAHVGKQRGLNKPFVILQEYQANYFSYHFCVPTFMLDQLKEVTVYDIMNLFNVEFEFALRRLEMHQSKILERKIII